MDIVQNTFLGRQMLRHVAFSAVAHSLLVFPGVAFPPCFTLLSLLVGLWNTGSVTLHHNSSLTPLNLTVEANTFGMLLHAMLPVACHPDTAMPPPCVVAASDSF